MRFGSVCSGIEAASVAWNPLGWEAAWLSEIEPFPSAVLAHHYPDVPNLGDMTTLPERILSGEVEAPDLFCGGTPCQAFSVAGLRQSLDDARGNLSLTFCEIANAIDSVRSAGGKPASIVFWENVPGVLSTKDNAFGCFLGGLAGEDEPLEPPGGKWTNAGYVSGPKRTVAWRILDAQYFGVAQRRRRVFVVASARDDFDPAAVLFEFDGVRRDSAPSREAGQRIAPCVTNGPPFSRTGNERVEAEAMIVQAAKQWPAEVSSTLDAHFGDKQGLEDQHVNAGCPLFVPAQPISIHPHCIGRAPEAGPQGKEYLLDGSAYCMDSRGQPQAVVQPITFQQTADCLTAAYGTKWNGNASATNGSLFAAQAMPINTMIATRHNQMGEGTGFGIGEAGDPAYTLTKGHSHAVAQPMVLMDQGGSVMNVEHDMVGTLRRETHGHEPVVAQPIGWSEELTASVDLAGTIQRGGSGGRHDGVMQTNMVVRRLTPTECERLQGFPDGYTNIPWRIWQESARKGVSYEGLLQQRGMRLRGPNLEECPDGPRYKALGNSWAVPVVRWIGKRIEAHLDTA